MYSNFMNIIEKTIAENIQNENAVFVFSVQLAAERWADRILSCGVVDAVATDRFIGWDTFKSQSIKSQKQTKTAIPSAMRKIFASMLIYENAETPFLKNLISPDYASSSSGFENWLSSLLPSLKLWKKKFDTAVSSPNNGQKDDEDADLLLIFEKYKNFLDEHNFFDPAWETPPFKDDGKHYFVFFPEILQDYAEYKDILEAAKDCVTCVSDYGEHNAPSCDFYTDSRTEVKSLSHFVRCIHEENGIDWQEITLSVPDVKSYGPYIEREFEINEIPFITREAKTLDETEVGSIFSAVSSCVSENFSFESVKNLLLNKTVPWNDVANENGSKSIEQYIKDLLEFGRKNNCICSYVYNGKKVDVWEKSFWEKTYERPLCDFYEKLKKFATNLVLSPSFSLIRSHYFAFREKFWNVNKWTDEATKEIYQDSENILSRCITALNELIELEENYPDCKVQNHYKFFENYLKDKKYLAKPEKNGICIIPYKTAALMPSACHVIVDASQSGISIIQKQLPFLNETKRKKFGLEDSDVSKNLIALYEMNSLSHPAHFSGSHKTWTGYEQVSSYLQENKIKAEDAQKLFSETDAFSMEKNWFLNDKIDSSITLGMTENLTLGMTGNFTLGMTENLKSITKTQKDGFEFWMRGQAVSKVDDVVSFFAPRPACNGEEDKIEISETRLKNFYDCPCAYFQKYIAKIKEQDNEAELVSPFAVGNLNHKIFELYFGALKEKNIALVRPKNDDLDDNLKNILRESVDEAIKSEHNKKDGNSFLANELIEATKNRLMVDIEKAIVAFQAIFDGCKVLELETAYNFSPNDKNYYCTGKIDCLLADATGEYILVDFKSSNVPKIFYYAKEANSSKRQDEIFDFQMPMYIYLLKNQEKPKIVEKAGFFNIKEASFSPVVGKDLFETELNYRKSISSFAKPKPFQPSFEEFSETMQKFTEYLDDFASRIEKGDFSVTDENQDFEKCSKCDYSAVCRKYFVVGGR